MRPGLFALTVLLLPMTGLAEGDEVISRWNEHHPAAAENLGDWVKEHPEGAGRLFQWNRHHPLRSRAFLRWIIDEPQAGLDGFFATHRDWPAVDDVLKPHREAVEALLLWVRSHDLAARDLVAHERGFSWVGFHLYRSLWRPEEKQSQPPDVAK